MGGAALLAAMSKGCTSPFALLWITEPRVSIEHAEYMARKFNERARLVAG